MNSPQRAPAEKLNRLTRQQLRQVEDIVKSDYAKLNLTDAAFAAHAAEQLGFPLTDNNIAAARAVFSIMGTREAMRLAANPDHLRLRVAALESAVQELRDELRRVGMQSRPQAPDDTLI